MFASRFILVVKNFENTKPSANFEVLKEEKKDIKSKCKPGKELELCMIEIQYLIQYYL